MPSYEYRCLDCRKRFDVFMSYKDFGTQPVTCRHCGSANVQRRIGKVRVARTSQGRLEDMADPANLSALDEDPKALGRMMRQMSSEVGEEMGPEFDEVVHRLEAGQSPDQIEQSMPDLGDSLPGDGGASGSDDDF